MALTIGLVGAGAMGSAVGAAYAAGGARVVTTLAGRSERTRRLAAAAGLDLLAGLDDVVGAAEIVLSIVPPGQAPAVAEDVAAAAGRTGSSPLVADLNAISPATMEAVAARLAGARPRARRRIDLGRPAPSGHLDAHLPLRPAGGEIAALPAPGIELGSSETRSARRPRSRCARRRSTRARPGCSRTRSSPPTRTACSSRSSTTSRQGMPAARRASTALARERGHQGRALRGRDA